MAPPIGAGRRDAGQRGRRRGYVVDRVPEENTELLRFLAGALLVPYHRVTCWKHCRTWE